MGLKGGAKVLEGLRAVAPKAWRTRIDAKVSYTVVAVDVFSIMFSLMYNLKRGHDLRLRLRAMLAQHRSCAAPDETREIHSIFALEDYTVTPPNKDIEREKRTDASKDAPYTDILVDGDTLLPVAKYEFGDEIDLPANFSRLRKTPRLMSKFLIYLCHLIIDEAMELSKRDPKHRVFIDGYRTEDSAANLVWSVEKVYYEENRLGEGEVKAVYWATRKYANANALVHANDGDIVALLALYSMRVKHEAVITGAMSQSCWLPAGEPDANDKEPKVFNSLDLVTGIFESCGKNPTKQCLIMPQTYFLFVFMSGTDYVDKIDNFGPAKIAAVLEARGPDSPLRHAVKFKKTAERIGVIVDEKAILSAIVAQNATLLQKNGATPQHLAGWIRRIGWAMDYAVNLNFLDPLASLDGKSLYGYTLSSDGVVVICDDVTQPTIVEFAPARAAPKSTREEFAKATTTQIINLVEPTPKKANEEILPSVEEAPEARSMRAVAAFTSLIGNSRPKPATSTSLADYVRSANLHGELRSSTGTTEARINLVLKQRGTMPFGEEEF